MQESVLCICELEEQNHDEPFSVCNRDKYEGHKEDSSCATGRVKGSFHVNIT